MQRYLFTARRFLWVLIAVVAVLTLSGGIAAYGEYVGTFESAATIWVQRNSQDLTESVEPPAGFLIRYLPRLIVHLWAS